MTQQPTEDKSDKTAIIVIVIAVCCMFAFGSLVIIGILAAIALPNFIGAQEKAKEASVRANMRTAQIATEMYGVDHEGVYPEKLDNVYQSYFPGGDSQSKPGNAPVNPFTGNPEWPTVGNTIKTVQLAREDSSGQLEPGQVEYTPIFDAAHKPTAYAIRGGGKNGLLIRGANGKALVLSNQ